MLKISWGTKRLGTQQARRGYRRGRKLLFDGIKPGHKNCTHCILADIFESTVGDCLFLQPRLHQHAQCNMWNSQHFLQQWTDSRVRDPCCRINKDTNRIKNHQSLKKHFHTLKGLLSHEVETRVRRFRKKNFSLQKGTKRNEIRFACVSHAHVKEQIFFSLLFASNFSLPTKAKLVVLFFALFRL